ncbi:MULTISPECIES: NAD(P)H-dependent oxidoreductase [unclassified Pseudonocardia]|uniref:flavodoxin family protein n=1 Tax=unclassified Pseudonocardia TaxID=2619320 RepID=UPI00095F65E9|nr:NAD(P)H-dependent oxidoreductase [Pseudonocardia sp. Ae707_Ps1]OLM20075.1 Trp repressor binding protein [Pseudonocardia sp. Ae707_Ps1]
MTVKLAAVYYSATGTVDAMARRAAEAGEKAGAEVRLRRVARHATTGGRAATDAQAAHAEAAPETPEATPDDIVWADAVLFGSLTRYGNIAGQLKTFIDGTVRTSV